MRRLQAVLLPLLAGALGDSAAEAQTCVGLPSFDAGALRLNVSAQFPDSAKAYLIGLGAGKPDGPFATAGVGRVSFVDLEERATLGFVEAGYQIPLPGGVELCPLVGGQLGRGPDDALFRLTVRSRGWAAGGAIGTTLPAGPVALGPNLAVRYEWFSQEVEEEGIGAETSTFDGSVLDLGLAVILGGRLSLQPLVHVPLSGDDGGTTLGLFGSLAFGLPGG